MDDEAITIRLTRGQALVLADWLRRVPAQDPEGIVAEGAVRSPVHAISGLLDRTLNEVSLPDDGPRLEAAEEGVRAELHGAADEPGAGRDPEAATVRVGYRDAELDQRLSRGLDEVNFPATGTTAADQGALSVKAVDEEGELIGGLSAWTWGGLLGIEMLWVREESRGDGWGSRLLSAAEEAARERGCDRACVSSFTFQAPAFYQGHGYVETGRTLGVPGGAEDVHMFKSLSG
ncbi:GNAT family N-acetyltransferase [Streptomyces longwoodensis]|uniref:GNAT family N-acetyltransferase n=2 Tax=Streptomyces longwoodensis TaxID=68231 RepID=UPI00225AFEE4|nr:GNAT family N-acetyltransferase [Streptomyces longwoodensis]MCX4994460.1 GNAT family N-acetyltransferase [Streptomyces longwoodensis]